MKYDEIRHAWNAQADDEKQWNSLTEAEKVEWAARLGAEKERGPAPIFRHEAVLEEREACAKVCEGFPANRDWVPGSLWGNIRNEMGAAIRARQ